MNNKSEKLLAKGSCIKCAISIKEGSKATIVGKEGDIFDEEYEIFKQQREKIDLEGFIACKNRRYDRKHRKAFDLAFEELEEAMKSIFKEYYSNKTIYGKGKVTFNIKLAPIMELKMKKVTSSGELTPKDIFALAEFNIIGQFVLITNPEVKGFEKAFEEKFEDLINQIKSYCL